MHRTPLDDIAARRPWNLLFRTARFIARVDPRRRADGVTVVIVNWNTRDITRDVISAVRHLSPPETRVLMVDNGSTDGSRAVLRTLGNIDTLMLPANVGHGAALDIALCRVRTQIAIVLDSDAVPLTSDWVERLTEQIASGRAVLAGVRASRGFVHPHCAAIDVEQFLERRLSFQIFLEPGVSGTIASWGVDAWDTGELLSTALSQNEIEFVDPDLVYHHGGVSRLTSGAVTDDAFQEWRQACAASGVDLDALASITVPDA